MVQSSLVETLSLLHSAELERFRKYVASPFFNEGSYSRDTLALLDFLLPFAPSFGAPTLEVEYAYAAIYPDKPFVKGKIEVVMSKLHQLLKQFAATEVAVLPELPETLRLAAFFTARGAPARAVLLLNKLREEQQQRGAHDTTYWQERLVTELQLHRAGALQPGDPPYGHLTEALRCQHHAYLTQVLELLNNLFFAGRNSPIDATLAEPLADGLPAALALADLKHEPLLRLMAQGFEFARHPEKKDLEAIGAFLDDLETYEANLPGSLRSILFSYARNYCTWHSNRGDTSFLPLLLRLFQLGLERGHLYSEGKIQAATLLNLVQTGLANREFEWVQSTLETCRYRIAGVPDPEGFYRYNLANYHYHQRNYERALDLLATASDGMFNSLMLRKLELKIYYETDSVLFQSKLDNFKLFVFRQGKKNMVESVFTMNNNFIDLLRAMAAPQTTTSAQRIEKLRDKLANTVLIAERTWLGEQLERKSLGFRSLGFSPPKP